VYVVETNGIKREGQERVVRALSDFRQFSDLPISSGLDSAVSHTLFRLVRLPSGQSKNPLGSHFPRPRVPPIVVVVYEAIFGVTQRFWAVADKQVHTGLGYTMVSLQLSIGLRVKNEAVMCFIARSFRNSSDVFARKPDRC